MAIFKMASLCYVAAKHDFVPVVTFDQPYIFEGDRDNARCTTVQPPRNLVQVVGGFHTFVNLLLSDWYTDGSRITKLGYYIKEDIFII